MEHWTDVELHGGPLDGQLAYVRVDGPDPGTALVSATCMFPGGRSLYEPDADGVWRWAGDVP